MVAISALWQDVIASVFTLGGAIAWLRIWDAIAARGWVNSKLSRKIIHITTGPLFVLCWPLFSDNFGARFGAVIAPLLISLQFIAVGLGWIDDPDAVQALTRSGDRREILKGPLSYGLIFILCTLIFWRTSPIGILGLMIVCGGDGFADIIGRKYGTLKLPWNSDKSWMGSLGMFLGAWLLSAAILGVYIGVGLIDDSLLSPIKLLWITIIIAIATLIESFPIKDWDNLTISLSAIALGLWLL